MKAILGDYFTDIFPSDDEVKELCRPGKGADTCSWLVMGISGWGCLCLNRPRTIIKRREEGNMVAMRDGCDKVNNFSPLGMELGEISF